MCQHASFRVTKTRVLWSRKTANHSDINSEYGISDRTSDPRDIEAVSVEIVPPDNDYRKPLAEWVFRVDQNILPDWWNPKEAEIACREVLPEYVKCHVLIGGTHTVSDGESHIYIDADVTVNGGWARFHGNSTGTVNGGEADFFGNSKRIDAKGKGQE